MNTTLAHQRHPLFKDTGHAIGANTTNRTVNLADSADEILATVAKRTGKTISEFIRQALADEIGKVDPHQAIAFRAAIREHARRSMHLLLALLIPIAAFSSPTFISRRQTRNAASVRASAWPVRRETISA